MKTVYSNKDAPRHKTRVKGGNLERVMRHTLANLQKFTETPVNLDSVNLHPVFTLGEGWSGGILRPLRSVAVFGRMLSLLIRAGFRSRIRAGCGGQ
jgi:hypothetical protein